MRVSASKLGLLMRCQWWARDDAEWLDSTSDAAAIGNEVHDYIARRLVNPDDVAGLSDAAKAHEPERAIAWLIGHGTDRNPVAEVAYAFDTATGKIRLLGMMLDRKYEITATEIAGSADVTADDAISGHVLVVDWKTGRPVDSASENDQLNFLSACAMSHAERNSAEKVIYYTQGHWQSRATIDYFDGVAYLEKVRKHVAMIAASEPKPGPWCRAKYCPARHTCPAAKGAVQAASKALAIASPVDISQVDVTRDNAADVLASIDLAQGFLDGLMDRIKEVVADEPIKLANGKVWGRHEKHRDYVDYGSVMQAAEQYITREQFDAATKKTVTKKAIIDAAIETAKKVGEPVRGLRKKVESDLRAGDALRSKTTYSWEAFKAPKEAK